MVEQTHICPIHNRAWSDVPASSCPWCVNEQLQAEIKRLNDETCLLAMIQQERDEAYAVIAEMQDGDNPELWGCLVADRNKLKVEVKRLRWSTMWHKLDGDPTVLPAIEEVVALALHTLTVLGVRVSGDDGWHWERVYDCPIVYRKKWSTEDSEQIDEEPTAWHSLPMAAADAAGGKNV